jgi:hypothetical protein
VNLRSLSCYSTPDYAIYKLLPDYSMSILRIFHDGLVRVIADMTAVMQASKLMAYLPSVESRLTAPVAILPLVRLNNYYNSNSSSHHGSGYAVEISEGLHQEVGRIVQSLGLDVVTNPETEQITSVFQLGILSDVILCTDYVNRIDEHTWSSQMINSASFSQLMHPVIRELWVSVFGPDCVCVSAVSPVNSNSAAANASNVVSIGRFVGAVDTKLTSLMVAANDPQFLSPDVKDKMINLLNYLLIGNNVSAGAGKSIDMYAVAKLFRCVSKEDTNLVSILTTMTNLYGGRRIVLIPPAPTDYVYFNPGQEAQMAAMLTIPGWHVVTGPHRSGKSCRLLTLLYQYLTNVTTSNIDVAWVDFSKIHSETDGYSRLSSQFFFKRCNTKETMQAVMTATLNAMQPRSIVVFDNISHGHATWKGFLGELFAVCAKFTQLVFVLCTTDKSTFDQELKAQHISIESEVVVKFIDVDVALEMAASMTPLSHCDSSYVCVDPQALVTASGGLSGEIRYLAAMCSLSQYRAIARNMMDHECEANAIRDARSFCAAYIFAHTLSLDEKALAYCLSVFSRVTYFDVGMAFAVSGQIVDNDLTRWRLAWNRLLDLQWVQFHAEFGFVVSPLPAHISIIMNPQQQQVDTQQSQSSRKKTSPTKKKASVHTLTYCPNQQQLFDAYCIYWARELKRLNNAADQNPCVLEEFTFRLTHFSVLLQCVFYKPNAPPLSASTHTHVEPLDGDLVDEYFIVTREQSNMAAPTHPQVRFNDMLISLAARAECIYILAGNMGRVLSYHLSSASAHRIASIVDKEVQRFMQGTVGESEELTRFQELSTTSNVYNNGRSSDNSIILDAVKVDLAEQCLRQTQIPEGLEHSKQPAASAGAKIFDVLSPTKQRASANSRTTIAHFVRALLVHGRLLMANEQTIEANSSLKQAASIYETMLFESSPSSPSSRTNTPVNGETHWEYSLTKRLIAETDMLLAVKNSLETNNSAAATAKKGGGGIRSLVPKLR